MEENRISVQLLKSKDILSGEQADAEVKKHFGGENSPKLPSSDVLKYGEIALNIAKGYEVIAIKNYDGEIIYLPFNVAARLLQVETRLEDLKDYSLGDVPEFNEFKESTIARFDSVESFVKELNDKIDSEVSNIKSELDENISSLSGSISNDVNVRIDSISETVSNTLDDVEKIGALLNEVEILVNENNDKCLESDKTRAEALAKIRHSLGFNENADYSPLQDELYGKNVSDAIDYLNEKIDSNKEDEDISIYELKNEFNDKLNAVRSEASNQINSINKTIDEKQQETTQLVFTTTGTLEANINTKIENLSDSISSINTSNNGVTKEELDEVQNYLIGRLTDSYNATNHQIEHVQSLLSGDTIELSGKVESISDSVGESISSIGNEVAVLDVAVSNSINKIKSSLGFNDEGDYIPQFEELSGKTVSEAIDYLDDEIHDKIASYSSDIEQLKNVTESNSSKIDSLSGNVASSIVSATTNISLIKNELENEIASTKNDLINQISESTSNNDEEIDKINKSVSELQSTLNNSITEISDSVSSIEENINGKIDSLSADVYYSLSQSAATLDNKIDETKTYLESQIVNSSNGSISQEQLDGINDTINHSISDLRNEFNQELNQEVVTINNTIDSKINEVNNNITSTSNELSNTIGDYKATINILSGDVTSLSIDVNTLSGELQSAIVEPVLSVQGDLIRLNQKVDEFDEILNEGEFVKANAIAKLKTTIGLTDDTEYKPQSNELSGLTIVEAIDYVNSASTTHYNSVNSRIDYEVAELKSEIDNIVVPEQNTEAVEAIVNEKAIELTTDFKSKIESLSSSTDIKLSQLSNDIDSRLSNHAEYANSIINDVNTELSSKIDYISGQTSTLISDSGTSKQVSELQEKHNADVATLEHKIEHVTIEVNDMLNDYKNSSALTDSITSIVTDTIEESNTVEAAAITQLNNSMGFDTNGIYNPETSQFSGMTITDVIDYMYKLFNDKIGALEAEIEKLK